MTPRERAAELLDGLRDCLAEGPPRVWADGEPGACCE